MQLYDFLVSAGKKGKRSKSSAPTPVNAILSKLHLADNGIDNFGRGANFAPIRCMQLFQMWAFFAAVKLFYRNMLLFKKRNS